MRNVTFAATQFACSWDKRANVAKAKDLVRQAASKGAKAMNGNRSLLHRILGVGVTAALTLGTLSVASPAQAGDLTGYVMPGNCQVAAEPYPEESTAYGVPPGTAGVSTRVLWAAPTDPTFDFGVLV